LAFYWGTSEWPADRIAKAIEICERENWYKPIVEQPEYSMLQRNRFEKEYRFLFAEYKYGTTIWSPLAGGLLSGKYNDGNIPEDSRYAKQQFLSSKFDKYFGAGKKEDTVAKFGKLADLAKSLGFS